MNNLTLDFLESLDEDLLKDELKSQIDILVQAINDWPNNVESLEEFEKDLVMLTKRPLTKKRIESALSNLTYQNDAWKIESLTQLLELFTYYGAELTLNEIFSHIFEEIPSACFKNSPLSSPNM
ncbi:MAG: hypothetical protein WC967_14635 [Balneolaceae bacterium]